MPPQAMFTNFNKMKEETGPKTPYKSFEEFLYKNMEGPVKAEFIKAFNSRFGYNYSSSVSRIFRNGEPTINQKAHIKRFLQDKDLFTELETAWLNLQPVEA